MVRIFLTSLFALAIAVPCHAQGKPNALTPKEIADGWILLFDGETTFGWRSHDHSPSVASGALQIPKSARVFSSAHFDHCVLQFDYKTNSATARIEAFHAKGLSESFVVKRIPRSKEWMSIKIAITSSKPADIELGERLQVMGASAILFRTDNDDGLSLRNIKLRPLNTISLFNGKDLTGWNVFPGKKSKFAVIDNAINVKDGPGDLQTVGKYKDFVLQLEAISNGKNLNSGIFFRCRDGEYQNGYEAQIHNGFGETPKKYLLEEYDAKTNKLIGKKEAMYTALDFGTGAIYRRVPARKQMSKDGEWFSMTVVAHGNHFATWVNGIQVTDWTDNRPKSDNARTGCKLEAGHLSIQGHDPTTDLSFRNFRIVEFK